MLSTATGRRDDLSVALLIPIVALPLPVQPGCPAQRRRREISGHDINAAAYTVRQDAERKNTEWTIGL